LRYSKFFIPTLKEEPSETEIPSHALSLRAGLIRKVASGIYSFLPLGLRVLKKIENIVRQEMDRSGAIELYLPVLQPSILWEKSGRWNEYGPELFRLKDRNKRDFCLGPTHEEIITYLAYLDIKSYKDLPVNLYQIQVKFRDEIRPRYGLLRAREFIMKDAYSFSSNADELEIIYRKMYDAYCRILERIGLKYRAVMADTGLIGGDLSHEFIVSAENGEEKVVFCPGCGYSENYDLAKSNPASFRSNNDNIKTEILNDLKEIHTPGITSVEKLAGFLKVNVSKIIKTILMEDGESNIYAFLIGGERELNVGKAGKYLKKSLRFFDNSAKSRDLPIGFMGPVKLYDDIKVYSDNSIKNRYNVITGANKKDYHLINVNYPRDFKVEAWGDFTYPVQNDTCINCGGKLEFEKGIEIGHIFKLGYKYSEKMDAKFLDIDGKLKSLVMGCYGIGITRIMAAAIEQLHDSKGIIWPVAIAPFLVNLIVTTSKNKTLSEAGDIIYKNLKGLGVEVLYDDRDISAGIKFRDSDLIGIPLKFILGKKYIEKKVIDVEYRQKKDRTEIDISTVPEFISNFKASHNLK
jgi:prolyl-tRNA synthetase